MPFAMNSVTVSKASRLLGKAPSTLKKLLASGAIQHFTLGDRMLIHMSEIDRYQRYGAYNPNKIQEQTNAIDIQRESQVPSQIKGSEIFRSDNRGTTLPTEGYNDPKNNDPNLAARRPPVSPSGDSSLPTKLQRDARAPIAIAVANADEERAPLDEVEKDDRANVGRRT